jgi:hypothetical protein
MLPQDGRKFVNVTTNKTLAAADAGIVQNVTVDGVVITLPATADGLSFTIRNGGDNPAGTPAGAVSDGSALVTVSPAAADQIIGNGFTPADDKDAINTKVTSNVGDEITLIGGDANGWVLTQVKGIWVRQP